MFVLPISLSLKHKAEMRVRYFELVCNPFVLDSPVPQKVGQAGQLFFHLSIYLGRPTHYKNLLFHFPSGP